MGVGLAVADDVAAARAKAKRVSAAVSVKAG
jgi:phosphoribosylglycinamide formyltransferase 2